MILERRCGAKFGESRPSQRVGHARKTSCRAKKQTGALAWIRRDKVKLFVPRSSVWTWRCVLPCALRVLAAGCCCFSKNNNFVGGGKEMEKTKDRPALAGEEFFCRRESAGGVEIFV